MAVVARLLQFTDCLWCHLDAVVERSVDVDGDHHFLHISFLSRVFRSSKGFRQGYDRVLGDGLSELKGLYG